MKNISISIEGNASSICDGNRQGTLTSNRDWALQSSLCSSNHSARSAICSAERSVDDTLDFSVDLARFDWVLKGGRLVRLKMSKDDEEWVMCANFA